MSKFKRKPPLCACECGERVNWNRNYKGWNKFISGHQTKGKNNPSYGKDKYKEERNKLSPLCACGCKKHVKWKKQENRWNKFISGHNSKGYKHTKEAIQKQSSSMRGKNNPNYRMGHLMRGKNNPAYGTKHTKEWLELASKRNSGSNNGNWRGGTSINPHYCEIWTDKEHLQSIRDRDNNKCQNPNCQHNHPLNRKLSVHHINSDKMNCHPWNLISLCCSCHKKAEGNKNTPIKYWINFYRNIITEKHGHRYDCI